MVKKTVLQTYSFREGLRDGLPIALGYLTVAFGFGLTAVQAGLYPLTALILSLINETSAGQTAGLSVIAAHGTLIEMALTQFIINLRLPALPIEKRFCRFCGEPWVQPRGCKGRSPLHKKTKNLPLPRRGRALCERGLGG